MRKSRFTEEQIIAALKEHEVPPGGTGELCRRLGVSTETLYRWRRKYGGMEVSEARRLRVLEEENQRLNAPDLLGDVYDGAKYVDGLRVEVSAEEVA